MAETKDYSTADTRVVRDGETMTRTGLSAGEIERERIDQGRSAELKREPEQEKTLYDEIAQISDGMPNLGAMLLKVAKHFDK